MSTIVLSLSARDPKLNDANNVSFSSRALLLLLLVVACLSSLEGNSIWKCGWFGPCPISSLRGGSESIYLALGAGFDYSNWSKNGMARLGLLSRSFFRARAQSIINSAVLITFASRSVLLSEVSILPSWRESWLNPRNNCFVFRACLCLELGGRKVLDIELKS